MQLARVIGEVVATIKDDNLTGIKLMVLQPIAASGDPAGRTLVALDSVGAGVGEHVFFVRGREAAFPFYPVEPPTDASIIGIVDHWTVGSGRMTIDVRSAFLCGGRAPRRSRAGPPTRRPASGRLLLQRFCSARVFRPGRQSIHADR